MLALALLEESTCDGCGGLLGDTTRPDAEDGYEVGLAIRCHRCTAIAEAVDRYSRNPHVEALRFPIVREPRRRPPAQAEDLDLPMSPEALADLAGTGVLPYDT